MNEASSIRGDPVEVLDVKGSKVFDFFNAFLVDRRFRLVETVKCKEL